MRAANPQPRTFSGVCQIFLYNWHFYASALALDVLAALFLLQFSPPATIRLAIWLIAAVATIWALSSLLVSYYIYDRSHLYQWTWLLAVLKQDLGTWANIHAGLDQASGSLMRLFPSSQPRILDIYAPSEMIEPSIARARQHTKLPAATEKANPLALPLEDCECDTILLIFVAHELRRQAARVQFFREVCRSLKPTGCVVLLEHLRDWKNFLAYGPGALHFFSRQEWLTVGAEAGFNVADELSVTPFVKCFVLVKRSNLLDT